MKKILLLCSLLGGIFTSYAQSNVFPTSGNVEIYGDEIRMYPFAANGGWARGLRYIGSDNTSVIGAIEMHGNSNTQEPINMHMAFGANPWTSGLGLYVLPNGNVGIGTRFSDERLRVSATNPVLNIQNEGAWTTGSGATLQFGHLQSNSNIPLAQIKSSLVSGDAVSRKGDLKFFTTNNGVSEEKMMIDHSGNIGIGTTNPAAKLHVFNGNNSYGAILANSSEAPFSLYTKSLDRVPNTEMFRLGLKYNTDENNGFISFYRGNGTFGGFLGFSTNGEERMKISPEGTIGIGTSNFTQDGAKLLVNGKILCEEVEVIQDVLPDYVFQKYYTGNSSLKADYVMPTLEEVETFTKANHHLPDVPSAAKVKEEGMQLKEMTSILLQKVEELTLYTIEQEKRIKALEAKLAEKK